MFYFELNYLADLLFESSRVSKRAMVSLERISLGDKIRSEDRWACWLDDRR